MRYIYEHSDSAGIAVLQGPKLLQRLLVDARKQNMDGIGLENDMHGRVKTLILMNKEKKSVEEIEKIVHPNHFLIFQFKKWVSKLHFSPLATSTDKIAFLEVQMKYHLDMMQIVEILDPGVTLNRASHHK